MQYSFYYSVLYDFVLRQFLLSFRLCTFIFHYLLLSKTHHGHPLFCHVFTAATRWTEIRTIWVIIGRPMWTCRSQNNRSPPVRQNEAMSSHSMDKIGVYMIEDFFFQSLVWAGNSVHFVFVVKTTNGKNPCVN